MKMEYEIKRLSFVQTIIESFKLYFDNLAPLFLISLVSSIPYVLMPAYMRTGNLEEGQAATAVGVFAWVIIFLAVNTLSTALMVEYISKRYQERFPSLEQYLRGVLPFVFPIIGLSIIQALLIGLGFIAFVIPGIYFAMALSVACQVLIVERKGVLESLRRSFFLTHGYKLEILGYTIVLFLFNFVVGLIAGRILDMLQSMQITVGVIKLLELLVGVLVGPIGACLFMLIYFNLRIAKEGFTREHLEDHHTLPPPGETY
jgi:hypothetical protein